MSRRVVAALVATSALLAAGCAGRDLAEDQGCEIARLYIEAGNRSDAGMIAPFLDDDVVAVFLSAESDHAETIEGREAVLDAVRAYKQDCPDCASTMVCHLQTDENVYVTEEVSFRRDGNTLRQRAPLVLEMEGERILRIIYFPAE